VRRGEVQRRRIAPRVGFGPRSSGEFAQRRRRALAFAQGLLHARAQHLRLRDAGDAVQRAPVRERAALRAQQDAIVDAHAGQHRASRIALQ
jgi:hypothetical protein